MTTTILVLLGLALGVALIKSVASKSTPATPAYRRRPLLTANEKEFFQRLRQAVPEYLVVPQVSMGALLTTPRGEHSLGARSKFSQKVVDYVLLDAKFEVVLLIELDDRTHSSQKDAARDRMTASAGYDTLRFESRAKPDVATLRRQLLNAL